MPDDVMSGDGHDDLRTHLLRRRADLGLDRLQFEKHWYKIQRFVRPFIGAQLGDKSASEETDGRLDRMADIFDSTPDQSADIMAAGFLGGVASPSRPWFKLASVDPEDNEDRDVQVWNQIVEDRMRGVFARSNTYASLHQVFDELGTGTACMGVWFDFDDVIRCRTYTVGEYYLGANSKYEIDTVYRDLYMTTKQLVEEFGLENVGESAKNTYKNGGLEQKWHVIHAVEPNLEHFTYPKSSDFPFRSVYLLHSQSTGTRNGTDMKNHGHGRQPILRMRGLRSFPYLVPRGRLTGGQIYGIGPYVKVLPDSCELHRWVETMNDTAEKQVDPPIQLMCGPSEHEVNSFPGGVTYTMGEPSAPLYQVQADQSLAMTRIQDLRMAVQKGLMTDLFLMLSSQDMPKNVTATAIAEMHAEKLQRLGPVLESVHKDLLTPLIERTFELMMQAGMIPEPPERLAGKELQVQYVSILAQAQQLAGLANIEQFIQFLGPVASFRPDVLDKVDADEIIDEYARRLGVPAKAIIADEDVFRIRAARAQQQQQQQQMAAAQQATDMAKTMSDTNVTGGSALNMLLGSNPPATNPQ